MFQNKKKSILIIGGTGFIGYHLAKKSLKKGWKVTSISTRLPKKIRYLSKVRYILCDITKKNLLEKKINQPFEYVVNLGGYVDHSNKKKTFQSHYVGCKNISEIFLKRPIIKFVQIGSSAEYGNMRAPQIENFKCLPNSPYALAKHASANFLNTLYKTDKYPVTILRFFLVYGPKQDKNRILPQVIEASIKDNRFSLTKGDQYCDFCYIDDAVKAIFKTFNSEKTNGEIINIGSGKPKKIKEVVNLVCKIIGKGKPEFGKIKYEKDINMQLYPSLGKAKKILNWKSETKLIDGLKFTINSYRN